jgi:YHS domain-containing protein
MKIILMVWTIILFCVISWSDTKPNVNKFGVMLDGYDPVSYFKLSEPSKGDPKFQVKQDGVNYWFSSEENKKTFLQDPIKYTPQYDGWCAYAVADSKSKYEVDPKSFVIQDGRLFLFYNGIWADTRKKWLHSKDKDPKAFLTQADANWPEVKTKDP